MRKLTRLCIAIGSVVLPLACAAPAARAADWPQWRGPSFDGHADETNLPDTLDKEKNLVWSAKLPGPSAATPVVFGDHIYLCALDPASKNLLALCLNRRDGSVAWSKPVGPNRQSNERNDQASPSPITDGKFAWFYFGTGELVAFDAATGEQAWARDVQKDYGAFNMNWIYASTPLLHGGKLYVPVLHRDVPPHGGGGADASSRADSFLLALDPQTGKTLWRVVRPNDAVAESKESYCTPVPVEVNGRTQIVLTGGDCVTGHDADSGRELWRTPSYNPKKIGSWRTVPSAGVGGGLVFGCPPKGGAIQAIRPEPGGAQVAWTSAETTSDVCVPLYYNGLLYVLNGDAIGAKESHKGITCLDPQTGARKWSVSMGGKRVFRSSPTGADGKIYCMNEGGDVFVVSADEPKVLSQTSLGSDLPTRSTIVVAGGLVFVRTSDTLYAFGKK